MGLENPVRQTSKPRTEYVGTILKFEPSSPHFSVPMSLGNMTYAYVPRDTITSLMSGLGVQDVPFSWNGTFLHQGDHVPSGIDMGTIGLVSSWNNNGVGMYTHKGGSTTNENSGSSIIYLLYD